MQPKTEVQFAIGVTEIVKTFISHPDHGLKPEEIPVMIKDIMKAFQDASHVSVEALTAAATRTIEGPVEQIAEAPAAVVAEEPVATPAPTPAPEAAPAKAPSASKSKSRSKSREAAPAAQAAAPAQEVVAEVVAAAPAPAPEKPTQKKKAAVDPLEAKFGGKISRARWMDMDPEAAIKNDEIICLIDGLGRKMLHRHLKARHNMTPEEYREWFHLRDDYPMTAPGYSKEKSDYAKVVGLGTTAFTEKTNKATPKTSRRSRKTQGQGAGARQRTTA
jgi:predicted transcriptional regulator